ncbi:hypothetical protein ABTL52_19975, partial [Acinetobacter baumannii]
SSVIINTLIITVAATTFLPIYISRLLATQDARQTHTSKLQEKIKTLRYHSTSRAVQSKSNVSIEALGLDGGFSDTVAGNETLGIALSQVP